MKRVRKSLLVAHAPESMWALVTDVAQYPSFVPWCSRAEVLHVHDDGVTARLHIAYMGLRQSFTTRNVHEGRERIAMELVDGPFSSLRGVWKFRALGARSKPQGCRIEFELDYAFASTAVELLISPVFDAIAATFVDAFVKRADEVYGPQDERSA